MKRSALRATPLPLLLALAAACAGDKGVGPNLNGELDPSATVFVTQYEVTNSADGQYIGRIVRDENGCLRRESRPESRDTNRHTFVWPLGWSLVSRDGELYVRDHAGQDRGRVGGSVRLAAASSTWASR